MKSAWHIWMGSRSAQLCWHRNLSALLQEGHFRSQLQRGALEGGELILHSSLDQQGLSWRSTPGLSSCAFSSSSCAWMHQELGSTLTPLTQALAPPKTSSPPSLCGFQQAELSQGSAPDTWLSRAATQTNNAEFPKG